MFRKYLKIILSLALLSKAGLSVPLPKHESNPTQKDKKTEAIDSKLIHGVVGAFSAPLGRLICGEDKKSIEVKTPDFKKFVYHLPTAKLSEVKMPGKGLAAFKRDDTLFPYAMDFTRDGRYARLVSMVSSPKARNSSEDLIVDTIKGEILYRSEDPKTTPILNPDGSSFLYLHQDEAKREKNLVVNSLIGKETLVLPIPEQWVVTPHKISQNGRYFSYYSFDGEATKIFDLKTHKVVLTLPLTSTTNFSFSSDGNRIVAWHDDGVTEAGFQKLTIYDLTNGTQANPFEVKSHLPRPDEEIANQRISYARRIETGDLSKFDTYFRVDPNGEVQGIDTRSGIVNIKIPGPVATRQILHCNQGNLLVTQSESGEVRIYDLTLLMGGAKGAREREDLWKDLGSEDPSVRLKAAWAFEGDQNSADFLKKKIDEELVNLTLKKEDVEAFGKKTRALIADFGSPVYSIREAKTRELIEGAQKGFPYYYVRDYLISDLQGALQSARHPEIRGRIQRVLAAARLRLTELPPSLIRVSLARELLRN